MKTVYMLEINQKSSILYIIESSDNVIQLIGFNVIAQECVWREWAVFRELPEK